MVLGNGDADKSNVFIYIWHVANNLKKELGVHVL